MAVIYLRHPIHGAKVACSDMEAEYDMNQGWEPFDPTAPAPAPAPAPVVEQPPAQAAPEPVNSLTEPRRRRRKEVQDGYHGG